MTRAAVTDGVDRETAQELADAFRAFDDDDAAPRFADGEGRDDAT
ncbi:MAG TPA: hypothetical protein VNT54_01310 [Solirubrobacteraceae bacterium]|nr:hypothetical protein [Solirubrobacteraceae bacterium]